jgi:hypothetical protein
VFIKLMKNLSFCGALPQDPASPVRAYKKALPKKYHALYTMKKEKGGLR